MDEKCGYNPNLKRCIENVMRNIHQRRHFSNKDFP